MQEVESVLAGFAARGIEFIADGDGLIAKPRQMLTDTDRATIRARKPEILTHLRADARRSPPPEPGHAAYSILKTCQRYGVLLRIDQTRGLMVGKEGAKADEPTQPWPSLIIALEAHRESVAVLVRAGWSLNADLQRDPLA